METISLQGKTNFFKKCIREYSKSGVGIDRADQVFTLDVSFELHTTPVKQQKYICHPLLLMSLYPRLYGSNKQHM
jgi:hypothetical protein